ncbi:hypothetical protein ASPZODRAFT_127536 [Penicilliopsis zonata CBS 506.65]|uniref:Transcription elongation factor Eaf N-terminal domain-containing protein n=1 Tax=Penicilliopsis zonata CBS 506.65 TaxID=1073090 RepID=A0A1L9SW82_9EURO|nr:hypothetical protein ASPZODRAFT_127536 [Penicilliopsis zonata CBS 506.65]OJJ51462.1 hypothetical protein ASPZODRAFT_127536 [Penicilliopsis zonata CBS 506.65]
MAAVSASSPLPNGGLIDPTKQGEYPIILGEKLAGRQSTQQPHRRLVNINFNYKSKTATPQQRSRLTRSPRTPDIYNLTITDKPPNSEQQSLVYSYEGSVDPSQPVSESAEGNLVLVFDPVRKAFVLESVETQLNFNLRSAPAKSADQVRKQYAQLKTLSEDEQLSSDDRIQGATSGDDEPADDSNPYDYRHFLPKATSEASRKSASSTLASPEPPLTAVSSKDSTPVLPATKKPTTPNPASHPPRSKPPPNPLRQKKAVGKPSPAATASPVVKPGLQLPSRVEQEEKEEATSVRSAELGSASHKTPAAPSPGPNIIIDGDLIIDMGSPPPSRPTFRVNPAHFTSTNTPSNIPEDDTDDDEEIEDFRLPSPAGGPTALAQPTGSLDDEEMEDDDGLLAEMEAALEESAREEEQAQQQYHQQHQYTVPSDDESEVSEEE